MHISAHNVHAFIFYAQFISAVEEKKKHAHRVDPSLFVSVRFYVFALINIVLINLNMRKNAHEMIKWFFFRRLRMAKGKDQIHTLCYTIYKQPKTHKQLTPTEKIILLIIWSGKIMRIRMNYAIFCKFLTFFDENCMKF